MIQQKILQQLEEADNKDKFLSSISITKDEYNENKFLGVKINIR